MSNIDKMVLGSIVGSLVLVFVLIVVIYSIRTRSLQEHIRRLFAELDEQNQEKEMQKENLSELARENTDALRIIEHYQSTETALNKELERVRTEKQRFVEKANELNQTITQLTTTKDENATVMKKVHEDLQTANEEIKAVLKRNEFWVEQLSELRTKHEALKLKLRMLEKDRA